MRKALIVGLAIFSCTPKELDPGAKPTMFVETKAPINQVQVIEAIVPDNGVKVEAEFKIEPIEHCSDGMSFIDLDYCSEVKEECEVWLDPPQIKFARCKKFKPSVCVGQWTRKTFCMDRYEYREENSDLPKANVKWVDAKAICESNGKRLCTETEFETACESGPDRQIHPYFTGLERPTSECNIDRSDLLEHGKLRDYRVPVDGTPMCLNSFTGVYNLVGNVDEFYMRDRTPGPYKSVLKGSWWMSARARCRPATTAHSETNYWSVSVGFRCCSDSK